MKFVSIPGIARIIEVIELVLLLRVKALIRTHKTMKSE